MTIEERMAELNEKIFALRAQLEKMGPGWGGPSGEAAFMQARLQVLTVECLGVITGFQQIMVQELESMRRGQKRP